MNIMIPDSWLREYLKTKATPKDIQRCLTLCGPSIERLYTEDNDIVYDVEVTTNRVDNFSVYGIAREAAAILPEFGIKAQLVPMKLTREPDMQKSPLGIKITDTSAYCRRILAVKLNNITLGPSPVWLKKRLELVRQRPLNNIIDITNYVMWETGHPIHAFDYDRLTKKKIIVREAKKGEHLITLDGKRHTLRGGELIFDDGTGEIIDLPGIMGTKNTVVTDKTKNVLLFIENSDPSKIRYASMGLGIRTQAATINEKGPDPELARMTITRAVDLACDIAKATVASTLFDHYPSIPKPAVVTLSHQKLVTYLGVDIAPNRVTAILTHLGFSVKTKSQTHNKTYEVTPPSWRVNDIVIPEDVIEEVSRIYGYHNIVPKLPDATPPMTGCDPVIRWEEEIKMRLRDWGYTEIYGYSMISEELINTFDFDKTKTYKIDNPLTNDLVYMRPGLVPTMLQIIKQNLNIRESLSLFELSLIYKWRIGDIPNERSTLVVALSGGNDDDRFRQLKGLFEEIYEFMNLKFSLGEKSPEIPLYYKKGRSTSFGYFGFLGEISQTILDKLQIKSNVTVLELDFNRMAFYAHSIKTYKPIPKYPPIYEDLAFTLQSLTPIGVLIAELKKTDPLIADITLLDMHKQTRTLHVTYQSLKKNLTAEDVRPIHEKLIRIASDKFGATLKSL